MSNTMDTIGYNLFSWIFPGRVGLHFHVEKIYNSFSIITTLEYCNYYSTECIGISTVVGHVTMMQLRCHVFIHVTMMSYWWFHDPIFKFQYLL